VPALIADCTGVLVAGGRATRLGGIPKGLLRIEGEPIAARVIRLFAALFDASLMVTNDPAPYRGLGVPIVPDLFLGKGAPGGVHAGLSSAQSGWIFAAACDMPFLSPGPIQLLASRRAGVAAVLPRTGGRLHPLHGLFSRACLPTLERLLTQGDPSFGELVRAVPACVVEEEEWRAADPQCRALENVNTPDDAERLGLLARPQDRPPPGPTET
jgi:molybdopterin-guanine dinucleotide biosynthesis protein A